MKIAGFQKTTLSDYPGEVACTIFLHGCNFRCGFCHNPDLVTGDLGEGFSRENILNFLKERIGKLDAVCISGGEPLATLDLDFVREIKALGYLVKIDTNGSFPVKLRELIDEGLIDYVAMDVKASKEKYAEVVCANVDMGKIEESIKMIHDFGNYEFRTTVVGRFHDAFVMRSLGRWLNEVCGGKPKKYFLQGFKKEGEMVDKSFSDELNVLEKDLDEMKECVGEYFEEVRVRV